MADTLEIVPQGQLEKLDAAIAKLDQATQNVVSLAEAAQTVNFKFEGIDSLVAFVNTIKGATPPINEAANAYTSFAKEATQVNTIIEKNNEGLGEQLQHYSNLKIQIDSNNIAIRAAKSSNDALSASISRFGSTTKANQESIDKLNGKIEENNEKIRSNIIANKQLADEIVKNNQAISGALDKRVAKEVESQNKIITSKLNAQQKILDAEEKRIDKENQLELSWQLKKLEQQQKADEQRIAQIEKQNEREQALIDAKIQYAIEKDMLLSQAQYKEGERRTLAFEREIAAKKAAEEKANPINRVQSQQSNQQGKRSAQLFLAPEGSDLQMRAQIANVRQERDRLNRSTEQGATDYARMTAEIDRLNAALIKNNDLSTKQRSNVGNYKSAADGFSFLGLSADQAGKRLATMAFRLIAMQLLFMPIITLVIDLAQGIAKLIPGTDAFIERQKELQQTLVQTKEELTSLIDKTNEFDKAIQNALGNGEASYQAQIDAVKALGVVKGQQFESELNQHKATQQLRDKQIQDLTTLSGKYSKLNSLFHDIDKGGDLNRIRESIGNLGLSDDDNKKFNQVLNDFFAARKLNKNLKLYGSPEVTKAESEANTGANKLIQQKQDADIAFIAKVNDLKYNKGIELEKDLSGIHEQLRQANEKEDIASLDKIVNDTRAKYALLAKDIERNKAAYLKTVTTPENAATYADDNIKSYNNILSLLHIIGLREQKNSSYEFQNAAYANKLTTGAALSSGAAGLAQNTSGIPDYNKSVASLEAETRAKKDALQAQFNQEAAQITDSDQVLEAQKQYDAKLIKIDKDAYRERLGIVNDYFSQIAQKISASTALLSTESNTRHLNALTAILTGRGPDALKEKRTFYENIADQKAQANIGLQDVANKLPGAQDALGKADLATKGPLSPEAAEQAGKAKVDALKNYQDLIEANAKYNNDIANADQLVHERKKQELEEIKNLSVQLAEETFSAVKTIQDNQFAKEAQQLDILARKQQIQNQQKIEAINASTQYQVQKDNQLAVQAAQNAAQQNELQQKQNQLAIKKAEFDKKAAEAGVLLHIAEAEAANLVNFAVNPVEATVIASLIAAIGAAQYAAAASTPIPQFWTGGVTETPVFSAGEKGLEVGITPAGQAVVFDKPGIYSAPIGTTIKNAEDSQKIIQYAIQGMNYAAPTFSNQEQNQQILAQLIVDGIGDKFEKVGYDLGYVIAKSKTVIPKQESMTEAARMLFNSQYSARKGR